MRACARRAVVRLRDRGARERVGLADVRARHKVAVVDLADRVRLREDEQVVVALELLLLRQILPPVTCRRATRCVASPRARRRRGWRIDTHLGSPPR